MSATNAGPDSEMNGPAGVAPDGPVPPYRHAESDPRGKRLAILTLTALGVVYGDIGTSPLYTIKETFHHSFGLTPTIGNVLGILSLIFWSLMLVVVLKYLVFVLRADNKGEGGVLAA